MLADASAQKSASVPVNVGTEGMVADVFERTEDKFLLPANRRAAFEELVQTRLASAYPDAETTFTLIESVYLDSTALMSFTDHLAQKTPRFKVRVRRYGPNGQWNTSVPSFLEIKTSADGVSRKERFRLGPIGYLDVMSGQPVQLSAELEAQNWNLSGDELSARVRRANGLITQYGLLPKLAIRYRRSAFEGEGVRVTLDEQLRFYGIGQLDAVIAAEIVAQDAWSFATAMQEVLTNESDLIVEAKYREALPAWFADFMAQAGIAAASMSKYCWSMSQHVQQALESHAIRG